MLSGLYERLDAGEDSKKGDGRGNGGGNRHSLLLLDFLEPLTLVACYRCYDIAHVTPLLTAPQLPLLNFPVLGMPCDPETSERCKKELLAPGPVKASSCFADEEPLQITFWLPSRMGFKQDAGGCRLSKSRYQPYDVILSVIGSVTVRLGALGAKPC